MKKNNSSDIRGWHHNSKSTYATETAPTQVFSVDHNIVTNDLREFNQTLSEEAVICKESYRSSFVNSFKLYSIVGETNHPSCSAVGKNAWIVKPLNKGATICNVSENQLDQLAQGYDMM